MALGREPLAPGAPVLAGEVDWAVAREAAATVEDVLYRRTRAALYEPDARSAIAAPLARADGGAARLERGEDARPRSRTRAPGSRADLAFAGERA